MSLEKSDELIFKNKTRYNIFTNKNKSIRVGRPQITQINRHLYSNTKLLLQEEIDLIAVTKHEVSISNFNITDQNQTFGIYTPRY